MKPDSLVGDASTTWVELARTSPRLALGHPDLQIAEQRHRRRRPALGARLRETYDAAVQHLAPHVFVFEDGVADRDWRGEEGHAYRWRM